MTTPVSKQRPTPSNDIGAIRSKVTSNPNLDPDLINKRMEQVEAESEKEKQSFVVPKELKGLEDLIFLGAGTRDVTVGDFSFQLATVTALQQERIYKGSLPLPAEERVFYFKRGLVATSLRKINGKLLSSYLEDDTFEARLSLIDSLQNSLFEFLYKELEMLIDETGKVLTAENLKK